MEIRVDWSGKMVHDGFASYDRFQAATHQQCLGHTIRTQSRTKPDRRRPLRLAPLSTS